MSNASICGRFLCSKKVENTELRYENTELRYELANSNAYIFRWSFSTAHLALSRDTPAAEHWSRPQKKHDTIFATGENDRLIEAEVMESLAFKF